MFKGSAAWFFIVIISAVSCTSGTRTSGDTLFQLMPSSVTGIAFNNTVRDTRELNIFNFRNFYNGAGVSVGDVNNDGLADIFFTANQGSNKLYINKGNWKFEDQTKAAGLEAADKWYTGVTMADVNGDGWLDIYVCNSGGLVGYNKPNDLYINQQNGTFTEQAATYGLADIGLSTHAAFFDYDHDGDLDCFVLNNSPRSIESFGYSKNLRNMRDTINGDRFYRNDNGKFRDVSAEAGIYGSEIGFGLGITVGDVNNDGWEDMYVSNDFFERDYLYVNNRNGTFSEVINEAIGHISQGSMGSDMIDINNDGWLDIFTTEMLPEHDYKLKTTIKFDDYDVQNARLQNDFHHQFTSNCLQLNNGDGTFSEIAQLAGVDATGWSWGALSFDFDNDGKKDLFVCNGISKDLTDQDFLEFFGSNEVLNKVKEGGFDFQDILNRMPSNMVPNYAFLNQGNLRFKNYADSFGLATPSFSNGAAYGDLDNDGDLDLVVNNENLEAFVYKNNAVEQLDNHYLRVQLRGESPNVNGLGARVTVYTPDGLQTVEQMPSRGFQSSVDPVLHFGLGRHRIVDSMVVRWPDQRREKIMSISADTLVRVDQSNASVLPEGTRDIRRNIFFKDVSSKIVTGNSVHRENQFIDFDQERLIPKMLSTEGPALAVGDVNNDGAEDFFLGNGLGDTAKLLVQRRNGNFVSGSQSVFVADKYYETTAAVFFDADEDGDMDLLAGSGGNQAKPGSPYLHIRLYINDGRGNFTRDKDRFPLISINVSSLTLCDFDRDGRQDVFAGARCLPGSYGIAPASAYIRNLGGGRFEEATKSFAPELQRLGMVTDAQCTDIDGDGTAELVVAGDWMPVTIFRFRNGVLKKDAEIPQSSGWWNCLQAGDVDGDGDVDLIGGNAGLNSRIKAEPQKPARLYVGDFDRNGQIECVPVYFKTDGKGYPYFMKGELQLQIPSLRKDFLYFSDYAGKSIEEVFTAEQLKNIEVLEVQESRTCLFRNDGKGNFSKEPLPLMAQLSYVFSVYVDDLNRDGRPDIMLSGNFFGLKPQSGRFDASYGVTLIEDGRGNYGYVPPAESGLFMRGEARKMRSVRKAGGGNYVVAAMNNDSLKIFEQNFY